MKRRLFSILLAFALLISLASCAKEKAPATAETAEKPFVPTSAEELWEKADSVMDALESYGIKQEMKMVFYTSGNKIETDAVAEGVYSNGEENYYRYMTAKNHMVCQALSMDETIESKEAYYDGKMYRLNKSTDVDQKLCSPISAEDYKEYEEDSLLEDVDFDDCMRKDFSVQEDGTWKLAFSGYTKKTIALVMDEFDLDDEMLGADVLDMDVAMLTDGEFRVKELEIKFLFDLKEDSTTAPEFTIKASYDRYNEAKFDLEAFLPEEYTEVANLLILDEFEKGIEEYHNSKKGKFVLTTKTETKFMGQTVTEEEEDRVSYGEENGSFYYDLTAESAEGKVEMNYRGGVLKLTVGGESESGPQTEAEAKETVDGLIDSAEFAKEYVTAVEKSGEDTYLIKIAKLNEAEWSAAFQSQGMEYVSGSQEISVTFKDGKLTQYSSNYIIQGNVREGVQVENITVATQTTLVFEAVGEQGA